MSDETKNTRPTKSQLDAWKKQHGGIYQLEIENEGILILREPKMKDLERAQASDPKKQKPYNFHRSIIENCRLYEDPGLLENDKNMLAVCAQIDEIVEIREATIKKL